MFVFVCVNMYVYVCTLMCMCVGGRGLFSDQISKKCTHRKIYTPALLTDPGLKLV